MTQEKTSNKKYYKKFQPRQRLRHCPRPRSSGRLGPRLRLPADFRQRDGRPGLLRRLGPPRALLQVLAVVHGEDPPQTSNNPGWMRIFFGTIFFSVCFFQTVGRQLISDIIFSISGKAIYVRQILFNPWKGRLFPTDFFRSLASKIIFDRFC